jgi:hypothetical protein
MARHNEQNIGPPRMLKLVMLGPAGINPSLRLQPGDDFACVGFYGWH